MTKDFYTVLVCDDDADIASAIRIILSGEGYAVLTAENGREALAQLAAHREISLVLLDVMMPVMDGYETLKAIRGFSNVPVLFLTAKGEDADKVAGLDAGADDYITKPFAASELSARVRSAIRRYTTLGQKEKDGARTIYGGIEMNDKSKTVAVEGTPVSLTPTEYDILRLFLGAPGRVFSPTEIYEAVWHEDAIGAEGTVAVHIRHIREKIERDPASPQYIKVVWGKGYRLGK